jgi:hypothetical protein
MEDNEMATRKKGQKRNVKRFAAATDEKPKPAIKTKPVVEKAPMQARVKENNAGFGVLKGVAIVILALIIGSAILFNRAGGRDAMRGDKEPEELCEKSVECAKGSICYAYGEDRARCRKTCSKKRSCGPDYTCVTAASQKRRRGFRLADICVKKSEM